MAYLLDKKIIIIKSAKLHMVILWKLSGPYLPAGVAQGPR